MLLYKFRALSKLDYFLDIIHNERFYCSRYDELNDPLEGMFREIICSGGFGAMTFGTTLFGGTSRSDKYLFLKDAYEHAKKVKICSFSAESAFKDIRMWSHYAEDHKGVVIEVDLPEDEMEKVEYLPEIFTMEKIGEAGDSPGIDRGMNDFILSHKTEHWVHEEEYRRIDKADYYNVTGKIKAVYLGIKCSKFHMDLLPKIIPSNIPIFRTDLDKEGMAITKTRYRLN